MCQFSPITSPVSVASRTKRTTSSKPSSGWWTGLPLNGPKRRATALEAGRRPSRLRAHREHVVVEQRPAQVLEGRIVDAEGEVEALHLRARARRVSGSSSNRGKLVSRRMGRSPTGDLLDR